MYRLSRSTRPTVTVKMGGQGRSPLFGHSILSDEQYDRDREQQQEQQNVTDPRRVLAALQELSRSRKRDRNSRRIEAVSAAAAAASGEGGPHDDDLDDDSEGDGGGDDDEEEENEDEEDCSGGCGANAPSSKRARRDSTSSSLSMEMPPLFSNGVVGQTTSQLVNRETELSLNSLLSRSQSMYQGSKLLYSSPTTGQQQQQLLHQRSQPFHTPCKRVSITQQQMQASSGSSPGLRATPTGAFSNPPSATPRAQKTIYNEVQSSLLSSEVMRFGGKRKALQASPPPSSSSSSPSATP